MNESPVLLFDGVCNLCNGLVTFILKNEKEPVIFFTTLQSEKAKQILESLNLKPGEINSVVFIEDGQIYFKSNAVFKIATFLKPPYSWLAIFRFLPRFITDFIYRFIAGIRYKVFGKKSVCMVPDAPFKHRFI